MLANEFIQRIFRLRSSEQMMFFFKTTADQTLVIEAHVGLDEKWRGGGAEERGGDGR